MKRTNLVRAITRWSCVAVTIAAVGCQADTVTPPGRAATTAAFDIQDASHGSGNSHFFWLPPIVNTTKYSGQFDASLQPVVDICALSGNACISPSVASFSRSGGTGGQAVAVDPAGQHFDVNWNTKAFTLDLSLTYRIRVRLQGVELGHADVRLASNGSAAKNVDTGDEILLVNGQTLPIKFRIEKGIAVIGATGGSAVLLDGAVTLNFPAGALASDAAITATPVQAGSAAATDAAVIGGTQYSFGPSPITFSAPVTLTLSYPASLPARIKPSRLAVCHMANGACVPLQGSHVDPVNHTITATISTFNEYGTTTFPEMCYMEHGFFLHSTAGETSLPACMGDISGPPKTGSWSPDGSTLVYCSNSCWGYGGNGPGDLRLVNADGTNDRVVLSGGTGSPFGGPFFFSCPQYSSDGSRILFGFSGFIGLMNADGTNLNYFGGMTTAPGCGQMLSPNGQTIMMLGGGSPGEANLVSMNVDGSNQQFLVQTANYAKLIGWSADGTKFAFFAEWAGTQTVGSGIYVMNANGSGLVRVAPYAREATWSTIPGDNRIAYASHADPYCECTQPGLPAPGIHIVDASGRNDQLVIAGEGPHFPRWSPDGLRLAIQWCDGPIPLNAGYPCTTYLINPDGSGLQFLLSETRFGVNAMWRP